MNTNKVFLNFFSILLFVVILPFSLFGQISEYQVEAEFLERFTRFIEWPESSDNSDTTKPFVLGIIGESPIQSVLEENYIQRKIKGERVELRYISNLEEILGCHMLVIAKSENKKWKNTCCHSG